jgi:tRNA nucleotidyltransferase/poly(A) polymerase
MELKQILGIISNLSRIYKTKKPYIVGGIPRDIYLKIPNIKSTDVDITTNSNDSLRLGVLFADRINEIFELSDDGHVTVYSKKYDIDFSSNFVSKDVVKYLRGKSQGLEEAFSRDFTINTLHQDLETGEITDPINKGFRDVENKVIRTPVPPEITFKDDPRRIYRAINLAARYKFSIAPEIIDFVKENKELFSSKNIKDTYAIVKINKALQEDEDLTIKYLKDMELFKTMPLSGRFKDVLLSKKYLADYLKNYLLDSLMSQGKD